MSGTYQVVALQPRAGIAKESGRPYNMLIVKGIYTNPEGQVDTAEIMFMESSTRKIPQLQVGAKYAPEIVLYTNRDGRLTAQIDKLSPLKAA